VDRLALRALLDKARDKIVIDCGYSSWWEMQDALGGPEAAKLTMEQNLPQGDWDRRKMADLVIESLAESHPLWLD
jgi:hypothetical protein